MEPVRSSLSIVSGLPREKVGSAPATVFRGLLSVHSRYGLHARGVAKRPFHRKLRQLRCLRCRFDCYRVERTSSRAGVAPAEVQRLSRRTFSPTTRDARAEGRAVTTGTTSTAEKVVEDKLRRVTGDPASIPVHIQNLTHHRWFGRASALKARSPVPTFADRRPHATWPRVSSRCPESGPRIGAPPDRYRF